MIRHYKRASQTITACGVKTPRRTSGEWHKVTCMRCFRAHLGDLGNEPKARKAKKK